MKKINIQRLIYKIKHDYLTLNNAVILIAFLITANWVWGALGVMQRNYSLQRQLEDKSRQLILAQLDTENAKLEQRYYKTDEYKELAVRQHLGLVVPGESVLVLPENTQTVIDADKNAETNKSTTKIIQTSNFRQWMNFLLGVNNKNISK